MHPLAVAKTTADRGDGQMNLDDEVSLPRDSPHLCDEDRCRAVRVRVLDGVSNDKAQCEPTNTSITLQALHAFAN